MNIGVIIPVKHLGESKQRLSQILSPEEREDLTKIMFAEVVNTIKEFGLQDTWSIYLLTVTPDAEVAKLAKSMGSKYILEESGTGVNSAVLRGMKYFKSHDFDIGLILPADIPLIKPVDLDELIRFGMENDVIITPSLKEDGTNALLMRPPDLMRTFYDQDSFMMHKLEAKRQELRSRIHRAYSIMLDIDSAQDVIDFLQSSSSGNTMTFLRRIDVETRITIRKINT